MRDRIDVMLGAYYCTDGGRGKYNCPHCPYCSEPYCRDVLIKDCLNQLCKYAEIIEELTKGDETK